MAGGVAHRGLPVSRVSWRTLLTAMVVLCRQSTKGVCGLDALSVPDRGIKGLIKRLRRRARKRPVATSIVAFLGLLGTIGLQWAVPKALDMVSSGISERVRSNKPVDVAIASGAVTFQRFSSVPRAYVIPNPIDEIPPPQSVEQAYDPAWKYALGGVDANYTEVQIVVQGRGNSPVILQNLEVRVVERKEPLVGTLIQEAGGDLIDVRYINVDLDPARPTLKLGSGPIEGEGAWSFPLSVSGTASEVIHIFASTESCSCSWVAELFYVYRAQAGSVIIDNNGVPFETTSADNVTSSYYVGLGDQPGFAPIDGGR